MIISGKSTPEKSAEAVNGTERFVGMHWFNRPHIIPLIEVINGENTSDTNAQAVYELSKASSKQPVRVKKAPFPVMVLLYCLYCPVKTVLPDCPESLSHQPGPLQWLQDPDGPEYIQTGQGHWPVLHGLFLWILRKFFLRGPESAG